MATRETLEDGRIIKYTVANETRAEIEAWAEMVMETGKNWDTTQPYCVIEDFQAVKVLTPSMRGFTEKVNDYFTTLGLESANIAVLIKPNSINSFAGRIFIERELHDNIHFNRRVFTKEEEALNWLKQFLPQPTD